MEIDERIELYKRKKKTASYPYPYTRAIKYLEQEKKRYI